MPYEKPMKPHSSYAKPRVLIVCFISLVAAGAWAAVKLAVLRIIIIGDSTAYSYAATDSLRGWGQELEYFFDKGAVTVINKAIGGRSSRSFIEDGHWASTLALIQKGDYVLISFGTNDKGSVPARHTDTAGFRKYLTQYVTDSRAKGANPVLISTVNQNTWSGTTFVEGFAAGVNDYRGAMLRVVMALSVPFIDLEKKSASLFSGLGQSYCSNFLFDGSVTHFQEMGAVNVAKLVAEGIKELSPDSDVGKLSAVLAPQYQLTVKSNKPGAGTITVSNTYPAGAPLTLKVVPKSGETFQLWLDARGKTVSTQTTYSFIIGQFTGTYIAAFKGGATMALHNGDLSAKTPYFALSKEGMLTIPSADKVLSVGGADLLGRDLRFERFTGNKAFLDIRSFAPGPYIVSVHTAGGSVRRIVGR